MTIKELASRILNKAIRDRDAGNGFDTGFAEAGIEQFVEQAITAAVEQEREACAQVADKAHDRVVSSVARLLAYEIRDEIRARRTSPASACNKPATENKNT